MSESPPDPPRSRRTLPVTLEHEDPSASDVAPQLRTYHYSWSGSGSGSGLSGFLLGALVLGFLVVILVVGALAFTVALWIALGVVLVGGALALIRKLLGPPQQRP